MLARFRVPLSACLAGLLAASLLASLLYSPVCILVCADQWTVYFFLLLSCSVDPFSKKDWYDVKAPAMFNIRNLGKTLVTRTQGTSKSK